MASFSDQSPVTFSDQIPDKVDVVVIGAGVIGISIAWFLAKSGVSVAVCEKGRVAGEQSSRNWGWIRKHGREAAELPIMMESIDLWESMSAEIDEDIGFTRNGVLYLAKDKSELARHESWLDIARSHGLDTRMLTSNEVDGLMTGAPGNWVGGAYTASDARAEPFVAVPALARALQKRGVSISENCAVRALDLSAGAISGVITEKGLIKCGAAVCAGGAWASLFSRNQGCDFPQLNVRATVARTGPAPNLFSGNAVAGKLAFARRQDGGYTLAAVGHFEHALSRDSFRYFRKFMPCFSSSRKKLKLQLGGTLSRLRKPPAWDGGSVSPFEHSRVLNPDPMPVALAEINRQVALHLPELVDIPIEQSWAGMIDVTPDIVPVIDAVGEVPGYYIAAGFCGHGFGLGPGAGRVMADMIMGNPPGYDMSRFRFGRFNDGSKLEMGPAL